MYTTFFYKPNNEEAVMALKDIECRIRTFIGRTSENDEFLDIEELLVDEILHICAKYGEPSKANDFPRNRINELEEMELVRDEILETQFQLRTYEELLELVKRVFAIQIRFRTYLELVVFVKKQLKSFLEGDV